MKILKGRVVAGFAHFTARMTKFPQVFREATGEDLFPGTLNIVVDETVPVREHFRIRGVDIGEPEQDLLFEICKVNGIWAYRIRPYKLRSGRGGHAKNMLEITSAQKIPNAAVGSIVEVTLFRDEPLRPVKPPTGWSLKLRRLLKSV